MNFIAFIIDAVLLLTFGVGWMEATTHFSYRFTWARLGRAVSWPLLIGAFFHGLLGFQGWPILSHLPRELPVTLQWLFSLVGLAMLLAVVGLGVPLAVMRLVRFGVKQWTAEDQTIPDNGAE